MRGARAPVSPESAQKVAEVEIGLSNPPG